MGREEGRKGGREGGEREGDGERRGSRKTVREKRQAKGEYHWQFKVLVSVGCYLETVQPFLIQAQQTIHTHTQPLFPSTCTQTKYSQHSHFSQLHRQYTKRGIYEVTWLSSWSPCSSQLSLEPRLSVPDFVHSFGEKSDFLQSCETKSETESLGSRLSSLYVVHLIQGPQAN